VAARAKRFRQKRVRILFLTVVTLDRVQTLKRLAFEKRNLDGFLIANETNMLYFTGVPGAGCLLVPEKGENTILVWSTNYEQLKAEAKGFEVELMKRNQNPGEKIAEYAKAHKIKRLGVDAVGLEFYRLVAKKLRGKVKLEPRNKLVQQLRRVKDESELELMRKAGDLTKLGMRAAYENIKPGVREYAVAAEIEYAMRRKGSSGTAFDTIVASGVRSAFPHGGCSEREIRNGDLVVVDIGATYQSYRSDMTRTFVAGKPSKKQEKLYEVVREAQQRGFEAIKSRVKAKDVDAAARKVIVDAGYGEYFVHGLGHGVGLEIHEPPVLGPESKERLMVGNVVTDEPGIYLIGFGGVRIEDTVSVRKRRSEKFTDGFYSLGTE
jgi:Xaa-Pro aminopeptidase